jgi:hypothetical protein
MKCSPHSVPVLELRHLDLEPGVARELGHLRVDVNAEHAAADRLELGSGSPKWRNRAFLSELEEVPRSPRASRSALVGGPAGDRRIISVPGARGQPAQPLPAVCR